MPANNPKGIIEGFDEDFCDIVDRFSSFSGDLELVKFLEFWNHEVLNCLFANRYDPRELVEAITHINASLVDKLTNTTLPDASRIIALYFIFCLYLKQPSHIQRNVRLTCRDAISIQELVKDKPEAMYRDARFVWHQLRKRQIIRLVEEHKIYGPSMLKKHGRNQPVVDEESSSQQLNDETQDFLDQHIDPHLSEIESMLETYQEVRGKLKLDEISDPTVEINSTGTFAEFIGQAKDMMTNYRQSQM